MAKATVPNSHVTVFDQSADPIALATQQAAAT
jgi:hypothetical protein